MLGNKRLSEKAYLLTTLLKNEGAREREAAKRARAAELEERFVNTSASPPLHIVLSVQPSLTNSPQIYTISTTTAKTTSAMK
jgi:hypothetical protein